MYDSIRASRDSSESDLSSFAKGSLRTSPFHILYNIIRNAQALLEFSLHEIRVGSKFYILLPKLNRTQMQALGARLKKQGFAVSGDTSVKAKKRGSVLHIDPGGLCWSNSDPADWIVPAIPGLLSAPKEKVPLETLKDLYFSLQDSGSGAILKLEPRIERGSLWRALRGTGEWGLAPDEFAVIMFLLEHTRGRVSLVTDFPTTSSRRRVIGGRQYFETSLTSPQARSTLSSVSKHGARKSYVPQRGVLTLTSFTPPSRRGWVEFFEGLGEWCYFRPH
jgi:hypothetical protein